LIHAGLQFSAGVRDRAAAQAILARAEANFRAARPDVTRIVDLRAQAAALVNTAGRARAHPVLATSASLIRAFQAHPAARLDSLQHAAPDRQVDITVSALDQASLDAIVAHLREQGMSVVPRTLIPAGGRLVLEARVEAPS
jgi:type II secretory pathway component PulL